MKKNSHFIFLGFMVGVGMVACGSTKVISEVSYLLTEAATLIPS